MLDPDDITRELDEALQYLLENNLISMTWNPEWEEISFFMTDEQKDLHDMMNPG